MVPDGGGRSPFTAFHPVPVWLLWIRFPGRFDFVALTVGAIVPDLFEPLVLLGLVGPVWGHRDWTHSLLGAVTVDAALAIAGTVIVARPLLTWADRRAPSGLWNRFAGLDFRTPRSWPIILLSVWVGSLSHVLLDVPFHAAFRLFFPAPTVWLYSAEWDPWAHLAADLVLGPVTAYLLYVYWWKPSRESRQKKGRQRVEG